MGIVSPNNNGLKMWIKRLFLIGSLLCSLFFFKMTHEKVLFANYPLYDPYYIRPTKPKNTNVRLKISVADNLSNPENEKIETVTFNRKQLPLSPADYLGNRGRFYFKIPAGTYNIQWTTRKNDATTVSGTLTSYEQDVTIENTDYLFDIEIVQNQLSTDILY